MLKTRAFVTAGFREPLLVGSLAIQRARRQDFALFNRIVVGIIALSDGTSRVSLSLGLSWPWECQSFRTHMISETYFIQQGSIVRKVMAASTVLTKLEGTRLPR